MAETFIRRSAVTERTPFNGRPFYCVTCGCGFGEFMACEASDCQLETDRQAQRRRQKARRKLSGGKVPKELR